MKTSKIFLVIFLMICLSAKWSSAQYDATVIGNNNGNTFVIPDVADASTYVLGVKNGGTFPL